MYVFSLIYGTIFITEPAFFGLRWSTLLFIVNIGTSGGGGISFTGSAGQRPSLGVCVVGYV